MTDTPETTEPQIAPRFITGRCPNYELIGFQIQVNTTAEEYNALARGVSATPAIRELQAKRLAIKPPPAAEGKEAEYTAEQLEQRQALADEIARLEQEQKLAFYSLFSRVFGKQIYKGYGLTLDLSTPAAAEGVLEDLRLPRDLKFWIRNAPIQAVDYELEQLDKNFETSFSAKK